MSFLTGPLLLLLAVIRPAMRLDRAWRVMRPPVVAAAVQSTPSKIWARIVALHGDYNYPAALMAIDVDTSLAPEILVVRAEGDWPTLEEQRTIRRQLMSDGYLTAASRTLVDIRQVRTPGYHEEQLVIAAALDDGGLPLVHGYLVDSAAQFGFSRQLQILAPKKCRVEIFTDERDAFLWLGRPR